MEIRVRSTDGVVILDISGSLDVNSAELVEAVGQCLRDGYHDILCNLEDTDNIDYLGISALVIAYKDVLNHNGRMKFVNVPVQFRNLFSVSGLDRAVEIYASEELAVNSFKEDKVIEDIKKMHLRRRFKRLPIDLKIEIKPKFSRDQSCLQADIINLSAVGCYIFGCSKFRLQDELILKFSIPPDNTILELEAKVVWLPDKQVQPNLYPGMGVEFINITPETQERIAGFIERNASSLSEGE